MLVVIQFLSEVGSQTWSECFQFNGRAVLSLKLVVLKARRLLVERGEISHLK